jgi:hypothetical protein
LTGIGGSTNDPYPTLEAKDYMLAADELVIREVFALKIERVTRGLFARQLVDKMRQELEEEKRQMETQEKAVQEELEHKRMVEIEQRRQPRTAWHSRRPRRSTKGIIAKKSDASCYRTYYQGN